MEQLLIQRRFLRRLQASPRKPSFSGKVVQIAASPELYLLGNFLSDNEAKHLIRKVSDQTANPHLSLGLSVQSLAGWNGRLSSRTSPQALHMIWLSGSSSISKIAGSISG